MELHLSVLGLLLCTARGQSPVIHVLWKKLLPTVWWVSLVPLRKATYCVTSLLTLWGHLLLHVLKWKAFLLWWLSGFPSSSKWMIPLTYPLKKRKTQLSKIVISKKYCSVNFVMIVAHLFFFLQWFLSVAFCWVFLQAPDSQLYVTPVCPFFCFICLYIPHGFMRYLQIVVCPGVLFCFMSVSSVFCLISVVVLSFISVSDSLQQQHLLLCFCK